MLYRIHGGYDREPIRMNRIRYHSKPWALEKNLRCRSKRCLAEWPSTLHHSPQCFFVDYNPDAEAPLIMPLSVSEICMNVFVNGQHGANSSNAPL